MTTLRFIPIFEDEKFLDACAEYNALWKNDGVAIVDTFKNITGLVLEEDRIAVLVYEGVSFSGRGKNDAMKLRASYENDVKKGTLIHELGHRLTFDVKTETSEENHMFLNLFLFDVWDTLYGRDFANTMVKIESARTEMYKHAWEHTLRMDFDQRQIQLHKILASLKE